MRSVQARARCRIDLAGGTLDIWPLGLLHPGARTVNCAVDRAVTVRLTRRTAGFRIEQAGRDADADDVSSLLAEPETALPALVVQTLELPPCTIRIESESPRGGGLGASSALSVALIAAGEALLDQEPSPPSARVALGRDLEARLMGLPTGVQDHWPALLGGALELRHEPGGTRIRTLSVDLESLARLLVSAYSGASHFSAGNNWEIVRRRLEGDPAIKRAFADIATIAAEMIKALESGAWERAGRLLGREWEARRSLAAEVTTPELEAQLQAAIEAGAWGGKACGAGGGGCLIAFAPPERRHAVQSALASAGAQPLEMRPAASGLEIKLKEVDPR